MVVIVQLGGQTPLNLARSLKNAGVPIIGTTVEAIERTEDREQFAVLLSELGLNQPAHGTARSLTQALAVAERNRISLTRATEFRARRSRDGNLL